MMTPTIPATATKLTTSISTAIFRLATARRTRVPTFSVHTAARRTRSVSTPAAATIRATSKTVRYAASRGECRYIIEATEPPTSRRRPSTTEEVHGGHHRHSPRHSDLWRRAGEPRLLYRVA